MLGKAWLFLQNEGRTQKVWLFVGWDPEKPGANPRTFVLCTSLGFISKSIALHLTACCCHSPPHHLFVEQAVHHEDEDPLHTVGEGEQVFHDFSQWAKLEEAQAPGQAQDKQMGYGLKCEWPATEWISIRREQMLGRECLSHSETILFLKIYTLAYV